MDGVVPSVVKPLLVRRLHPLREETPMSGEIEKEKAQPEELSAEQLDEVVGGLKRRLDELCTATFLTAEQQAEKTTTEATLSQLLSQG
jgi:hypothetical protein